MGINKGISDMRENILKVLNNSPYPIEVKRLTLFEIFTQISRASTQVIKEEAENENKEGDSHGKDEA